MSSAAPVDGPSDDAEFEDLYDRAPCGLLTTHMDGTITRVNATLLALLGAAATSWSVAASSTCSPWATASITRPTSPRC